MKIIKPNTGMEDCVKALSLGNKRAQDIIGQLVYAAKPTIPQLEGVEEDTIPWYAVLMLDEAEITGDRIVLIYDKLCNHHAGAFLTILGMIKLDIIKRTALDRFYAQREIEANSAMVIDLIPLAADTMGHNLTVKGFGKGQQDEVLHIRSRYIPPAFDEALRQ